MRVDRVGVHEVRDAVADLSSIRHIEAVVARDPECGVHVRTEVVGLDEADLPRHRACGIHLHDDGEDLRGIVEVGGPATEPRIERADDVGARDGRRGLRGRRRLRGGRIRERERDTEDDGESNESAEFHLSAP